MLMCFYFLPFLAFRRLEMKQLLRSLLPPSMFCCSLISVCISEQLCRLEGSHGNGHSPAVL